MTWLYFNSAKFSKARKDMNQLICRQNKEKNSVKIRKKEERRQRIKSLIKVNRELLYTNQVD